MARKAGGPTRLAVAGKKAIPPEKKNFVLPAGAQLPGGRGMPEASRPKNGWPMRLALFGLVSERWKDNACLYYDLEPTLSADLRTNNPARRLLWNDLVEQAQARPPALIFRGQRGGAVESINPELLSAALANFESDTIAAGEVVFHGVRVWPAAELQARRAIEIKSVEPPAPAKAPAVSLKSQPLGTESGDRPGAVVATKKPKPTQESANSWMLTWVQAELDRTGFIPKQATAVRACMDSEMGISATDRSARTAHRSLPRNLRMSPGRRK